jgi:hypothetical protein
LGVSVSLSCLPEQKEGEEWRWWQMSKGRRIVWEAEEQANAEIFLIISKFAKNALKVWNVNRDGKRGSELLEEE